MRLSKCSDVTAVRAMSIISVHLTGYFIDDKMIALAVWSWLPLGSGMNSTVIVFNISGASKSFVLIC